MKTASRLPPPVALLLFALLAQPALSVDLPPTLSPVVAKNAPAVVSILVPASSVGNDQETDSSDMQPSLHPSAAHRLAAAGDYQTVGSGVIIDAASGWMMKNGERIDIHPTRWREWPPSD